MNQYITGAIIKKLRESRGLTQCQLADQLHVSDKSVSKWETGKGYPDISLMEPLASALKVSVLELLAGENVINANRSFNMLKACIHVCPVCGNVLLSTGAAVISCCGIQLPALDAEEPDEEHRPSLDRVEDEVFLTLDHPMTKDHYIAFIAALRDNGWEIIRLYPEGPAEARIRLARVRKLLWYCNHHGLFALSPLKRKGT